MSDEREEGDQQRFTPPGAPEQVVEVAEAVMKANADGRVRATIGRGSDFSAQMR